MAQYYKCELCGNVLEIIEDGGVTPECCGQSMTHLSDDEYRDVCNIGCGK